jgi:transposase
MNGKAIATICFQSVAQCICAGDLEQRDVVRLTLPESATAAADNGTRWTDGEAICEAVTRANMRFIPTKTPEQQSCLMLHRTRHLFIRQQTAVINSIRAHLAKFGIVAPVGRKGVAELLHIVADPSDKRVSEVARACLAARGGQLLSLKQQIVEFDRMILAWRRSNRRANAFITFPG